MNISERQKLILDNAILIYPEFNAKHKFAVVVEDSFNLVYKKSKTTGQFKHTTNTINQAIKNTVVYVSDKIINQPKSTKNND